MSGTNSNVRVAVTGAVYVADAGATLPTDATSAVAAPAADLGYVSEDGVTETRDRSTEKIKAWQGSATVREVTTDSSLTYSFTLIETKKETVELFYGSEVDDAGMVKVIPGASGGRHAFVIDVIDGDDFIRTTIEDGEVSEVGDQVYAAGEPIGYEVTVTCYPDGDGVAARKFYSALDTAA
jgi:hypothetical protein